MVVIKKCSATILKCITMFYCSIIPNNFAQLKHFDRISFNLQSVQLNGVPMFHVGDFPAQIV